MIHTVCFVKYMKAYSFSSCTGNGHIFITISSYLNGISSSLRWILFLSKRLMNFTRKNKLEFASYRLKWSLYSTTYYCFDMHCITGQISSTFTHLYLNCRFVSSDMQMKRLLGWHLCWCTCMHLLWRRFFLYFQMRSYHPVFITLIKFYS